jgi:hypothetical protein
LILTITLTLIFAAIRGYKLRSVLREKALYPFFILEFVLIVFQITTFFGSYVFVPYAAMLKTFFMVSLLLPFFKYRLYKPGIIGASFAFIGTLLNKLAINLNGGKMPVFPSLSYLTGYTRDDMFLSSGDTLHILGNEATKVKILTDIFDFGYSILSIGDFMIRAFVAIILYATVASVCEKRKGLSNNG